jgi:nitronate monooxygenase
MSHSSDALHTRICDTLDIQYPIVQAGMGAGLTPPDLVAAVSNGGGLGILGAHLMPEDRLRAAIRAIKERTARPFGVNFIIAPPESGHQRISTTQQFLDRFRSELGLDDGLTDLTLPPSTLPELLVVAFEERVPVLSLGLGDPTRFVQPAHDHGMSVIAMVSTVDEGRQAAVSGVDVIAAQGAEAGGHRSNFNAAPGDDLPQIGTFALVPQLVDAIDVPVLAAGGVMDGRGVTAALALGAEGVLMGTRFLTARESGTFSAYRDALLQATEVDTVVSHGPTGRPARSLRNRLVEAMSQAFEPLPYPLQAMAAMDIYMAAVMKDRADLYPLWAGQGLRLLTDGQPAQEIVSEIVEEATSIMRRFSGRVAS